VRVMAAAAKDARLKKRTLTNLYNERPTWLKLAHEKLDRAVLAAYAAVDPASKWDESWAEVWVDSGAAAVCRRSCVGGEKTRGESAPAGEFASAESRARRENRIAFFADSEERD
jgi:hypothetical protein